jgi:CBS domain-containing protein
MSSPLVVVTPQTSVDECMALMTNRRIRHRSRRRCGEVTGIVSIGDVVKFKVEGTELRDSVPPRLHRRRLSGWPNAG